MELDLSVKIGSMVVEHPIMNAAGTVKTMADVEKMARSASVSIIMVGSGTVESREGNPGHPYYRDPVTRNTWNSWGLPNPGLSYYEKTLREMRRAANDAGGKRLAFSIAGFQPEEYQELARMACDAEVDAIEVNLGCPNVWSNGQQKDIACFNQHLTDEILRLVMAEAGKLGIAVWVKTSPFTNPADLDRFAGILGKYSVAAITATNTFPNASAFDDDGNLVIASMDGFAGASGPCLTPLALGNVRKYRKLLPHLQVIGAGGVGYGRAARDFRLAGAAMLQIASAFLRDSINLDYTIFQNVLDGLIDTEAVRM